MSPPDNAGTVHFHGMGIAACSIVQRNSDGPPAEFGTCVDQRTKDTLQISAALDTARHQFPHVITSSDARARLA
jgi:hypothetical protein